MLKIFLINWRVLAFVFISLINSIRQPFTMLSIWITFHVLRITAIKLFKLNDRALLKVFYLLTFKLIERAVEFITIAITLINFIEGIH